MESQFPLVIGISGATNGGKTSLSEQLQLHFTGCRVINMDEYFYEPDDPRIPVIPELNHGNWESTDAVDLDKLYSDIKQWIDHKKDTPAANDNSNILLVEGILIFHHPQLCTLFQQKYFLTLDKDECLKRRTKREYFPPDPEGYFELVVWPHYLENKKTLKEQEDIVYISGNTNFPSICDRVIKDIEHLLQ